MQRAKGGDQVTHHRGKTNRTTLSENSYGILQNRQKQLFERYISNPCNAVPEMPKTCFTRRCDRVKIKLQNNVLKNISTWMCRNQSGGLGRDCDEMGTERIKELFFPPGHLYERYLKVLLVSTSTGQCQSFQGPFFFFFFRFCTPETAIIRYSCDYTPPIPSE